MTPLATMHDAAAALCNSRQWRRLDRPADPFNSTHGPRDALATMHDSAAALATAGDHEQAARLLTCINAYGAAGKENERMSE